MINIKSLGDFKNLERFLLNSQDLSIFNKLEKYGEAGVAALAENTPIDSGIMADSWYYEIKKYKDRYSICFYNSKIQNGTKIALILDYGHATATGGYVVGRNFIKPSLQPVFDDLANNAWEEVKHA